VAGAGLNNHLNESIKNNTLIIMIGNTMYDDVNTNIIDNNKNQDTSHKISNNDNTNKQ